MRKTPQLSPAQVWLLGGLTCLCLVACQPEQGGDPTDVSAAPDATQADATQADATEADVVQADAAPDTGEADDAGDTEGGDADATADTLDVSADAEPEEVGPDAVGGDVDASQPDASEDAATDTVDQDTDASDSESVDATDASADAIDAEETTDANGEDAELPDVDSDTEAGDADGGDSDAADSEDDSGDDVTTDVTLPPPAGSLGGACYSNSTCNTPLLCDDDVCIEPSDLGTCDDDRRNGTETDVDCGGDCPPCPDRFACASGDDCVNGVCAESLCQPAACDDGIQNGRETDLDCGAWCAPCIDGGGCLLADDCASGLCTDGVCSPPRCGDGITNGDDACDDRNDRDEDGCRADCTLVACGDGRVDWNEACDAGEANSDVAADACRTDCSLPSCGDGVTDAGESCDDGNGIEGDGCSNTCTLPACGDGIVDSGEECDDGNDVESDRCSSSCVVARCGDGVVQVAAPRDALRVGFDDSVVPEGLTADGWQLVPERGGLALRSAELLDLESTSATLNVAASHPIEVSFDLRVSSEIDYDFARFLVDDAVVGEWSGELMWTSFSYPLPPGNYELEWVYEKDVSLSSGDDALWLDNLVVTVDDLRESCDDGLANSDVVPDACRSTCVPASCGDGVTDADEGCDDGNDIEDDGCGSLCGSVGCGDGIVQVPEECDDGNLSDFDRCTTSCLASVCGDGIQQEIEPSLDLNFSLFSGVPNGWEIDGWVTEPNLFLPLRLFAVGLADGESVNASWRGNLPVAGRVEFHFEVSSEPDDDLLEFYVDDERVVSWSGEQSGRVGFDLDAGTRTLTWRYVKDAAGSGGDDEASFGAVRIFTTDGVLEECDDANGDPTDRCQANCEASRCGDGIVHEIPPTFDVSHLLTGVPEGFEAEGWEPFTEGFTPFGLSAEGLGDSESATLSWTGTLPGEGSVYFTFSVDSEEDADFLEFYIDGQREAAWSGQVSGDPAEFPLEAGERTLTWRYVKNGSGSAGNDRAIVTFIEIATSDSLLEECDDANDDDTDLCTSVCERAACGDGILHDIPPSTFLAYLFWHFVPEGFTAEGWVPYDREFGPLPLVPIVAEGVPDGGSAVLTWVGELEATGRVSFAGIVSSEEGRDFLEFSVNGELVERWSGEFEPDVEFSLPAGAVTLEWRYTKDAEGAAGDDEAGVRLVIISTDDGQEEECDEGDANSNDVGATCDLQCNLVD